MVSFNKLLPTIHNKVVDQLDTGTLLLCRAEFFGEWILNEWEAPERSGKGSG